MSSLAIGVEIGGTKLQLALGDAAGNIHLVRRGQVAQQEGAQGILAWIEQELPPFLEEVKEQGYAAPVAIGVGFGGPIETETGTVLVSHQIKGWKGVALKQWFAERFPYPVTIANDSNAAGWAEYCCGAGKGTRNFCYNNIGSGIGGALVLDGHLWDGAGRGASEIGHTYVADWTSDTPGAMDKLEHLCSGWSIEKRLHSYDSLPAGTPLHQLCDGDPSKLTCPMLAEAAHRGDAVALAEIDHIARAMGAALSNVITLFHPQRLAMGGGVSLMGDILLDPIRNYTEQLVFGPFQNQYEIVPCALGENVVTVGALLLALSDCQAA